MDNRPDWLTPTRRVQKSVEMERDLQNLREEAQRKRGHLPRQPIPTLIFDPERNVFTTANGDEFSAHMLSQISETEPGTWARIERSSDGYLQVRMQTFRPTWNPWILTLCGALAGLLMGMAL